jgi:PhnB protein
MQPTPYLFFNGTCADAIAVYTEILEAEVISKMLASDMPPDFPVPDDKKDWIMHADIKVGKGHILMSDNLMEDSAAMSGASVMLSYPTRETAESIFNRLSEGGSVTMAFEPTFWSGGFGTCIDRFGIRWMIDTDAAS